MFRRRRSGPPDPDPSPAPAPDGRRDADLPMLSVEQAAALTALAMTAFERHGAPVQPDFRGALIAADARVFGLHNLAVLVGEQPFAAWAGIVDAHVASLLVPDDEAMATPDRWLLKLRRFVDVPTEFDFDATCPLPGIAAVPALDLPTAVHELLGRERVRRFAEPEAFRERALANLRVLPAPERTILRADDARADSEVHVLATDDFFGAARALVLDHLLAEQVRVERPAHGVLVAVPNRHLLVVHLVTGPGVIAALQLLVRLAEGEFGSRPGPVSDDVFHLPGGGRVGQLLTARDDDGGVRVVVDGPFAQVLHDVGGD